MTWLSGEIQLLLVTAMTIGVVHTVLGPDHYLPFVALARERKWSDSRTLAIAALCGIGHCVGSVVLGFAGIAIGISLVTLEAFEASRGTAAAWVLLGFGIAYAAWSVKRGRRKRAHSHRHTHPDGTVHTHSHSSDKQHLHAHTASSMRPLMISLLVVFLLGPCEALIPMLMYPAAQANIAGVAAVAIVFSLSTVLTMLLAVSLGLRSARLARLEISSAMSGALTGAVISSCGLAMLLGF